MKHQMYKILHIGDPTFVLVKRIDTAEIEVPPKPIQFLRLQDIAVRIASKLPLLPIDNPRNKPYVTSPDRG